MPAAELTVAVDAPPAILQDVLEAVHESAVELGERIPLENVAVALRMPHRQAAIIEHAARAAAGALRRAAAAQLELEGLPNELALTVDFVVDSDAPVAGGQPLIVAMRAARPEEARMALALTQAWGAAQAHPRWAHMAEEARGLLEAVAGAPAPPPALAAWLADPRLLAALRSGEVACEGDAEALRAAIAPVLAPSAAREAWERALADKNAHVLRPLPGGPPRPAVFGAACTPDEWRALAASAAFCLQRVPAQRPLRTLPSPASSRPAGHHVRGSYTVCGGRGAFGLFRLHAAGHVPADPPRACPLAVAIAEPPACPAPPRLLLDVTPSSPRAAAPSCGPPCLSRLAPPFVPPSPPVARPPSPPALASPSSSGSSRTPPCSPPPLRRAATHGGVRTVRAEDVVSRSLRVRKAAPSSPAVAREYAAAALAGLRLALLGPAGRCGRTLERTHSNALQLHRAGSFPAARSDEPAATS